MASNLKYPRAKIHRSPILVVLSVAAAVVSQSTANAASVTAAATNGIVVVNDVTGAISWCNSAISSTGTPVGRCLAVGAISPTSLSGNVRIQIIQGDVGMILNAATGNVVECSLVETSTGQPTGSCAAIK